MERNRQATHGVVAVLADADQARAVMDALEDGGVPADAISLELSIDEQQIPEPEQTERELVEMGDAGMAITLWALTGAIVGAAAGFLVTLAVGGWSLATGLLLGGVFGGAIGGVAGGMRVAKYASPVRPDTYLAANEGRAEVHVEHVDESIIARAVDLLDDQPTVFQHRF